MFDNDILQLVELLDRTVARTRGRGIVVSGRDLESFHRLISAQALLTEEKEKFDQEIAEVRNKYPDCVFPLDDTSPVRVKVGMEKRDMFTRLDDILSMIIRAHRSGIEFSAETMCVFNCLAFSDLSYGEVEKIIELHNLGDEVDESYDRESELLYSFFEQMRDVETELVATRLGTGIPDGGIDVYMQLKRGEIDYGQAMKKLDELEQSEKAVENIESSSASSSPISTGEQMTLVNDFGTAKKEIVNPYVSQVTLVDDFGVTTIVEEFPKEAETKDESGETASQNQPPQSRVHVYRTFPTMVGEQLGVKELEKDPVATWDEPTPVPPITAAEDEMDEDLKSMLADKAETTQTEAMATWDEPTPVPPITAAEDEMDEDLKSMLADKAETTQAEAMATWDEPTSVAPITAAEDEMDEDLKSMLADKAETTQAEAMATWDEPTSVAPITAAEDEMDEDLKLMLADKAETTPTEAVATWDEIKPLSQSSDDNAQMNLIEEEENIKLTTVPEHDESDLLQKELSGSADSSEEGKPGMANPYASSVPLFSNDDIFSTPLVVDALKDIDAPIEAKEPELSEIVKEEQEKLVITEDLATSETDLTPADTNEDSVAVDIAASSVIDEEIPSESEMKSVEEPKAEVEQIEPIVVDTFAFNDTEISTTESIEVPKSLESSESFEPTELPKSVESFESLESSKTIEPIELPKQVESTDDFPKDNITESLAVNPKTATELMVKNQTGGDLMEYKENKNEFNSLPNDTSNEFSNKETAAETSSSTAEAPLGFEVESDVLEFDKIKFDQVHKSPDDICAQAVGFAKRNVDPDDVMGMQNNNRRELAVDMNFSGVDIELDKKDVAEEPVLQVNNLLNMDDISFQSGGASSDVYINESSAKHEAKEIGSVDSISELGSIETYQAFRCFVEMFEKNQEKLQFSDLEFFRDVFKGGMKLRDAISAVDKHCQELLTAANESFPIAIIPPKEPLKKTEELMNEAAAVADELQDPTVDQIKNAEVKPLEGLGEMMEY